MLEGLFWILITIGYGEELSLTSPILTEWIIFSIVKSARKQKNIINLCLALRRTAHSFFLLIVVSGCSHLHLQHHNNKLDLKLARFSHNICRILKECKDNRDAPYVCHHLIFQPIPLTWIFLLFPCEKINDVPHTPLCTRKIFPYGAQVCSVQHITKHFP